MLSLSQIPHTRHAVQLLHNRLSQSYAHGSDYSLAQLLDSEQRVQAYLKDKLFDASCTVMRQYLSSTSALSSERIQGTMERRVGVRNSAVRLRSRSLPQGHLSPPSAMISLSEDAAIHESRQPRPAEELPGHSCDLTWSSIVSKQGRLRRQARSQGMSRLKRKQARPCPLLATAKALPAARPTSECHSGPALEQASLPRRIRFRYRQQMQNFCSKAGANHHHGRAKYYFAKRARLKAI